MANIRELLIELKYEMFKNILLSTFLRAVIAFFIFDIIFVSILDFWYVFSYIFAGAYFVYKLAKKMKSIHLKTFEKNNPEIKEMLTTAADNVDRDNIVVSELFKEVIHKVRKLSSGTLIVPQTIMIMILVIPALAVIDFETSRFTVEPLSQEAMLEGLQKIDYVKQFFNRSKAKGDIIEDNFLDEDIYGERRIAQLGDQEIDLKMNLGFETDLTRPKEVDADQVTFKDYPDDEDIDLVYDDDTDIENFEQEKDLVLKYNEKIRNLG